MRLKTTSSFSVLLFLAVTFISTHEVSTQLATCLNYGTPLNSTDCKCPGFVAGRLCETVKCQRFSVPDQNRCVCPPGWYDKYCGIRGCRPPNEDNLDLQKRSLIIVFNMKTSMKDQLQSLRNNFKQMVSSMTTDQNLVSDNWIANFIIYGFVQANQNTRIVKTITQNIDDALDFLNKMELTDGADTTQPVLTALKNAQQTFPDMKSHAIVLVFTDSPASDATPWSHRFTDKNAEQSCLQISLLWRSKVSFLLSLPNNTDTSSNGVDVYRRLSLTNHGDTFFLKDSDELSKVLTTVISTYYFPENLAVAYGKKGDEILEGMADGADQTTFYLLTFSPTINEDGVAPIVSGMNLLSGGSSYRLYTSKGLNGKMTILASDSDIFYNYRVFVQSKQTVMFDYNDDMHIDVGNGMAVIGIPMSSTMQTYGFPDWNNSSYEVRAANGEVIREPFFSYLRPQKDCTFLYGFPVWDTLSCPAGPISQVHNFFYNDGLMRKRVTAGYCIESDHNAEHPDGVEEELRADFGENGEDASGQCSQKNIDAVNDPRLFGPNQFIFVLELHSSNQKIYATLSNEIGQIVNLVSSSADSSYQKEFSLIIHDDRESRVLLSTYNPTIFVSKFQTLVHSLQLNDNLDNTLGLLSIVQAQKMNIRPTAQVFYFTNQAVKNVQNVDRDWDIVKRDIEINFLTIADFQTNDVFSLPNELDLVRKMSNGRIIPLVGTETTLISLFSDMMSSNVLTTDEEQHDCHSNPLAINGFVEKNAEQVVVQVVGYGINSISIIDANGTTVNSNLSFHSANFMSLSIDLKSYAKGVWKISTQTGLGKCGISIRQKTSVGVILGFTSSGTNDDVSTQIITQRIASTTQPIFVPLRVVGAFEPRSMDMEIQIIKKEETPKSVFNSTITTRDSCAYNYISESLVIPKEALTSWTVSATDNNGMLILHRIFYYYQHIPSDTSVCQGGKVDDYGRCICPQGFTGDYCWDRICQPAATYSFGICSCPPGFYGDFCEIELVLPVSNTSSTTAGGIQTTTSSSSFNFYIFSVFCTILGFLISL